MNVWRLITLPGAMKKKKNPPMVQSLFTKASEAGWLHDPLLWPLIALPHCSPPLCTFHELCQHLSPRSVYQPYRSPHRGHHIARWVVYRGVISSGAGFVLMNYIPQSSGSSGFLQINRLKNKSTLVSSYRPFFHLFHLANTIDTSTSRSKTPWALDTETNQT